MHAYFGQCLATGIAPVLARAHVHERHIRRHGRKGSKELGDLLPEAADAPDVSELTSARYGVRACTSGCTNASTISS